MRYLLFWLAIAGALTAFDEARLDQFIKDSLEKDHVPGASVAIVREGQTLFLKGYGIREVGRNEKVDPETLFQLASVSKTFTSAAIGVLVDRNKLDWDRPVILDFPEFSLSDIYAKCNATPRDLLAHRSGLPSFRGDILGHLGYSTEEIVKRVRFIPFETTFREKALYSNVGFLLAGELTAKVAGKTWKEWVQEILLVPLKMSRTGFKELLKDPNLASAHALVDGKIQITPRSLDDHFTAAGGLISCAKDLATWMKMHLGKGELSGTRVLSEHAINEIFRPAMVSQPEFAEAPPIPDSPFFCYSLGWGNYTYKSHLIIEKGGALDGVRTVVVLIPELKMGIAVLANLNLTLFPERVRAYFLQQVLGNSESNLEEQIDRIAAEIPNMIAAPKPPIEPISPSRPLKDYAGEYESSIYGRVSLTAESDSLILLAGPGKYRGNLKPFSSDTFLLTWPLINLGVSETTFTLAPDGHALSFSTDGLGNFLRIEHSNPANDH